MVMVTENLNFALLLRTKPWSIREKSAASAEDELDEFFCFDHSSTVATNCQQEVNSYLNDDNRNLETLQRHPVVKQIFLKYNTGTFQWLFSAGVQILTHRRNKLSDGHFGKMFLFLLINKNLSL